MESFGEKLKQARKEKGFSQQKLAELMKISRAAVTNYEINRNTPTYNNIKKLSSILGVDFNAQKREVNKVRIVGTASCGRMNNDHLQDSTSFAYYNGDYYKPSLYCIIANGDSMAPEIEDGDEVICDPDADIQNGDIVHYKIGAESAIKVYVKDEDAYMVQFIPYNSSEDFKTKTIRLDDDIAKELEINKVVAVNKLKFNNRLSRLKLIGRA